jgi:hypothetical protein
MKGNSCERLPACARITLISESNRRSDVLYFPLLCLIPPTERRGFSSWLPTFPFHQSFIHLLAWICAYGLCTLSHLAPPAPRRSTHLQPQGYLETSASLFTRGHSYGRDRTQFLWSQFPRTELAGRVGRLAWRRELRGPAPSACGRDEHDAP